jgi:RNA-directed DNA polymerase
VDELLRSGQHWVLDADLKSYFDTIPHERLMERVAEKVADGKVLSLIEGMLQAGVMDIDEGCKRPSKEARKGQSSARYYQISTSTDWTGRWPEKALKWSDTPRTSSFCVRTGKKRKRRWKRQWVEENGLKLHPTKTQIVDAG